MSTIKSTKLHQGIKIIILNIIKNLRVHLGSRLVQLVYSVTRITFLRKQTFTESHVFLELFCTGTVLQCVSIVNIQLFIFYLNLPSLNYTGIMIISSTTVIQLNVFKQNSCSILCR